MLLCLFGTQCKQEEPAPNTSVPENMTGDERSPGSVVGIMLDAYNFYSGTPWKGFVEMNQQLSLGFPKSGGRVAINGDFSKSLVVNNTQHELLIGGNRIDAARGKNGLYKSISAPSGSLFGTNTTVSLGRLAQSALYLPKEMVVSSPLKATDGPTAVGRNVLFNWNADPNNSKGVVVIAEFSLEHPYNKSKFRTLGEGYQQAILTEDNGHYTLNLDPKIPNGAFVTLHVGRGNYAPLGLEGENYAILGYTLSTGSFLVQE